MLTITAAQDDSFDSYVAHPIGRQRKWREGKIKVRMTPNVFQRTLIRETDHVAINDTYTSNSECNSESSFHQKNQSKEAFFATWQSALSTLLPRGLILLTMAVMAIVEPTIQGVTDATSQRLMESTTASSAAGRFGMTIIYDSLWNLFRSNYSQIQWTIRKLPWTTTTATTSHNTSLADTLLSAMILVWVPTLFLQGSWMELTLIMTSMLSTSQLRVYTRHHLWPTVWTTLQQAVSREIWKQLWEFVLPPFSFNILFMPSRPKKENDSIISATAWNVKTNDDNNQGLPPELPNNVDSGMVAALNGCIHDFWYRLHIRIEKMTSSLLKKSVEKSVQATIGSLVGNGGPALHGPLSKQ